MRQIKKVWKSIPTMEGAGVRLNRAFGFHEVPQGSAKGRMWGFQLWANLPKGQKMMDPRYREITSQQIPTVKTPEGATVRIISGSINGVQGPVKEIVTDPEYLDVSLPAGKSFTHAIKPGYTAFAYVVEGQGYFDPGRNAFGREAIGDNYFDMDRSCVCKEGDIALYERAGDTVLVAADKTPVRFLLVSGKPLKESIAWYGPIVMNTQQELETAFREFQDGSFIKHGAGASR